MKSVWEQTGEHRDFAPLKGDISTDVLIIGGGMAGILCAYLLHGAGVPYVLTEAETVCGGITKNTTAKITIQHGLIYDKLLRRFGIGRAGQYLCAQKALCKNTGSCVLVWTVILRKKMPMSMRWKSKESWNRSCRPWKGWASTGTLWSIFHFPFLWLALSGCTTRPSFIP